MAKAKDQTREGVAAKPADFGRAFDAAPEASGLPLHPLMAHPAATLAAMTAVGFGFATQMASAFLGSLQGALEVTDKLARRLEEEKAGADEVSGGAAVADAPLEPATAAQGAVPKRAPRPKTASAKTGITRARPAARKATAVKSSDTGKVAAAEKPAAAARPTKAKGKVDDLKRIEGIGPKLEQVLNGRGIRLFADLAALDAADLQALDQAIGLDGRAVRDDWAGQARKLARGRK